MVHCLTADEVWISDYGHPFQSERDDHGMFSTAVRVPYATRAGTKANRSFQYSARMVKKIERENGAIKATMKDGTIMVFRKTKLAGNKAL